MIVIRRANLEDCEKIASLEAECFAMPWSDKLIKNEIASSKSLVLVALDGDLIIGYAMCMLMYDEIDITKVAVKETYRRGGIGDGLIRQLVRLCEDNGYYDITLEVRASNVAAIKLYEKNSFTTEGVRKHYYDDNHEDALIMWRRKGAETGCKCCKE